MKKRISVLLLAGIMLLLLLPKAGMAGETVVLSFKAASGYDYLKTLNGRTVSVNGYLATSSPVDGSFIFLMNLPYQSCPFCKPNTSELSNTLEVYPREGQRFGYTSQAVQVTGRLEVAPSPDQPFTDRYGYEFSFKIVDAEYRVIRPEELSPEMAVWQKIAEGDVISEVYRMYDYLWFLCDWPEFSVEGGTDENGNAYPGYYLYASDAKWYLETEGAQFNYGWREGYFDDIIESIRSCDPEAFEPLVNNIEDARLLAMRALADLNEGKYTFDYHYVERFETEDYVYTLDKGEELQKVFDECYYAFTDWLGSWEM